MRLKGENALLRKRYDEQQRAIEEGKGLLRCAAARWAGRGGTLWGEPHSARGAAVRLLAGPRPSHPAVPSVAALTLA